ncbi:MAG: Bax inhibitor-1/YccA family protein [Lachnospiraceae bacterium]|nr:Bax inhibitor-1/YccA family protein [Lachnospiraceae bacterium]
MEEAKAVGRSFGYGMCNPVIRKMERKSNTLEITNGEATYQGVAGKTIYFLLCCVLGAVAFFVSHNILMQDANTYGGVINMENMEGWAGILSIHTSVIEAAIFPIVGIIVLFAPLFAWLIRPAIPVVGTLYALCEGYLMGAITAALADEYKWISLVAFVLTVLLVGVMLILYVKRVVKVTKKFKTIVTTCFLTMIFGGIAIFLLGLIPAMRPIIMGIKTFMDTPAISIGCSILYIIIAALFLLVDFDTIETCVERKMPKKLEWMAAFGLVYTVIYIYFKILNLILQIVGNSKKE